MSSSALDLTRALPLLARVSLRWVALALIALGIFAGHPIWLGALGDQLVVSDPLEPADAIIVLAGHSPARAQHGLELYQAGWAPRVIVSDEEVESHGLVTTWGMLHRRGIAPLPVPDEALYILPISRSTYEEALRTRDLMLREGLRSAILVTDPFHSRRAIMTFAHVLEPAGLSVRVSPAQNTAAKDVEEWWLDEKKSAGVAMEYLKFAYYAVRGRLF